MTGPTVEVRGGRELRSTLRKAGSDLGELKAAHAAAAALVTAAAVGRAPRGPTGRLAGSIRPGATKTAALVRAGGARVPYANAIHWGTGPRPGRRGPHNIASNPFITEAAQATEPTWGPVYARAVAEAVDNVRGA